MASQPLASATRCGKSRHMDTEPRPSWRKTIAGAPGRGWAETRRMTSISLPRTLSSFKSDSQMLLDESLIIAQHFAVTVENHLPFYEDHRAVGD